MANFRGRGRPPKRAKPMDHGSLTVTAGVRVVPQEQDSTPSSLSQHISLGAMLRPAIKEEEKEEEWSKTSEPMKPRKRGRPRKIISQSLSSSLVQVQLQPQDDQNDKAANRKELKENKKQKNPRFRVIRIRIAPDPEATESSTDEEGDDEKTSVIPQNGGVFIRKIQLQLHLDENQNNRNKVITRTKKKKMNGGVYDPEPTEIPRRERSRRATKRRVAYASNPPFLSSDSGEDFATTRRNTTVQSSPSTSELEVPGPIPDFSDLIVDMGSFLKDFFQDSPEA